MITNPFEIPVIQNLETFSFFIFFIFLALKFIHSLETSTKLRMIKYLKHKSIYFMHMLTLKQSLHLSKVHSEMKTFMNKSRETTLNWSFILMLLITVDKVSESGWICVDQRLNFVFESRAILHGMPPNSFMVFTSSIDIVPFWILRSFRPCKNDRNPIILDQYGEQLSIEHWKWMVHLGPFPSIALRIAWIRLLTTFPCKPLRRRKTDLGNLGVRSA